LKRLKFLLLQITTTLLEHFCWAFCLDSDQFEFEITSFNQF
jgi:hypothetical protein